MSIESYYESEDVVLYNADCIEKLKELPENSVDSIVTDPPYFLINKNGIGFMGKEWESLNNSKFYNTIWQSKEFVKNVAKFFMSIKVNSSMVKENIVQENANIKELKREKEKKSNLNVQYVERNFINIPLKSNQNINSVQGIALTKQEVLDMFKEVLKTNTIPKELQNIKKDALFVIPFLKLPKEIKNIVPENVLKSLIKKECEEKIIQVTLMEEVRIKGVIEGIIGMRLEERFMKEIKDNVQYVEKSVKKKKFNVITLNHTERIKIMKWITSLLFVTNATQKLKGNQNLFLMYQLHKNWAKECLRVLKPGGHLLSFGGSRTYHRMVCGIEDAGFEVRDMIEWFYGQGFPKSLNIGKQVDKIQGNERKKVADGKRGKPESHSVMNMAYKEGSKSIMGGDYDITKGNSKWEGWGTALKPAHEPIVVARKPLSEKNVALNVLKWGVGGINIDESRIKVNKEKEVDNRVGTKRVRGDKKGLNSTSIFGQTKEGVQVYKEGGRFPTNLILDEESGKLLDEQSGKTGALAPVKSGQKGFGGVIYNKYNTGGDDGKTFYDGGKLGGASRFFYCAKASKSERNAGLEEFEEKPIKGRDKGQDIRNVPFKQRTTPIKNQHPTVKPIKLMDYLVKLVTPKGGVVLDPFTGSGSTGVACVKNGFKFIGIEKEEEYVKIAEARIKHFSKNKKLTKFIK